MAYPFSKIEKKWTKKWLDSRVYEPELSKAKKPFYNLMMFPYPSAEGLHVGNMYAFVGSDIYGRFQRTQGNDVFEPIGLDGFGIHSENYALKIGTHPAKQAQVSEKNFYRQLNSIGNGFAWNEHLETYDPEYYKWTQWIFIQLFKRGLAYRKKQSVNWCPSCKTVLADEQVIAGHCERCNTKVIKKELEQWFFRITKYADRLLRGLDSLDWSERVKVAQRNWIGRSEGALISFELKTSAKGGSASGGKSEKPKTKLEVFTTRPDTIYGATYLVLSPEHEKITNHKSQITNWKAVESYIKKAKAKTEEERIIEGKTKTGIELKGVKAINPATKNEIPVWVADYVLGNVGTGAIMAVPAYDERDLEFAKKFNLPIVKAKLVDKNKIIKQVGGKKKTQYRLRDWLISRQRYWGPPIPMIFCEACGWRPVPEKDLPVKLPLIKNFRPAGKGESPLASVKSFYEVKCPKCGGRAKRETDVSDTFLDSAWYFFRYLDLQNRKEPFSKERAKKWLPVNTYIGGAEHSVLHLLYSRFITMVFKDIGLISFDEPYSKFRAHGLLISEGTKMSKSKGNVVIPDEYIKKFGADVVRTYLMFIGPFEQGGDWRDAGIMGPVRFLNRVWDLGVRQETGDKKQATRNQVSPWLHASIKEVAEDIAELKYNTAISELMTILNKLEKEASTNRKDWEAFLLLLAPFAPFITEELWQKLGGKYSIHKQSFPKYDPRKLVRATGTLIIQVNGKFRSQIETKLGTIEKEAEKLALADPKVKKFTSGNKIKKTIFVKDKLINFVI